MHWRLFKFLCLCIVFLFSTFDREAYARFTLSGEYKLKVCTYRIYVSYLGQNASHSEVEYIYSEMAKLFTEDQIKYRFFGGGYGLYLDGSQLEFYIAAQPKTGPQYINRLINDFNNLEDGDPYDFRVNETPLSCREIECDHESCAAFVDK